MSANPTLVKLTGVRHLTNSIRNSGSRLSIPTAEAFETQGNDLQTLATILAGEQSRTSAALASGSAPIDATYIVQVANGSLTNAQILAALATGLLKNTTVTGVLSIAAFVDLPAPGAWANFPSGPTIGSDAAITTANLTAKYFQWGKLVFIRVSVDVTTTTVNSHYVNCTLPVTPVAGQNVQALCGAWGANGPGLNVALEGTGAKVRGTVLNGAAVASGYSDRVWFGGSYEAA